MRVRPKKDFKMLGTSDTLDKTRAYKATKATNQPNWEAKGLIFVGNFLLGKDDYEVVAEESDRKSTSPDFLFCWWA